MNPGLNLSDNTLILMAAVAAILILAIVFYLIFVWLRKASKISSRLDQFVAPEDQPEEASRVMQIVPREISGSLFSRTILNWIKKILQFVGRFSPQKMSEETEHKLTIAGKPANMSAADFFAVQLLVAIGGVILAFFVNRTLKNITSYSFLISILAIIVCLFMPNAWLNGRMRSRQNEIQRGLPDALDMLSVCASAGLGFDQSLQKISIYWENELGNEFKRVTQEMEMGIPRSTALRNMSDRLEVNDLSQFISIIIQAEKIGMSYATVLHSQALQLRVLRQVRAREIANQLPGKIIIPVILFIFPALIAVILGPAVPVIMNVF